MANDHCENCGFPPPVSGTRNLAVSTEEAQDYFEERNRVLDAMVREQRFHALRAAELKDFLDGFGISSD